MSLSGNLDLENGLNPSPEFEYNVNDINDQYLNNISSKNFECFSDLSKNMTPLTLDRGVLKEVMRIGEGDLIKTTDFVTMNYTGYIEGQDEPFDSTYLRDRKFRTKIDEKRVILGFQMGIPTMRLKEVSRFIFQPEYAYFNDYHEARIPKNSTVMFEIEILKVTPLNENKNYFQMAESERIQLDLNEVFKIIGNEKNKALEKFKAKKYQIAINLYKEMLEILFEHSLRVADQSAEYNTIHISLLNNIALCYFNLNMYDNSLKYCKKVLKVDANNFKALFRMILSYICISKFEKSKSLLDASLEKFPGNSDLESLLKFHEQSLKDSEASKLSFARRMFQNKTIFSHHLKVDDDFKSLVEKNLT
ncbi:MAG: Inactive peptidyl-prolyl cis-trans isomerase fkbp6 [Marteilia pararefringens]